MEMKENWYEASVDVGDLKVISVVDWGECDVVLLSFSPPWESGAWILWDAGLMSVMGLAVASDAPPSIKKAKKGGKQKPLPPSKTKGKPYTYT